MRVLRPAPGDRRILLILKRARELNAKRGLLNGARRPEGKARRPGTLEEARLEVADVLIVTAVFAEVLDIDVDTAVRDKLQIIYSRDGALTRLETETGN